MTDDRGVLEALAAMVGPCPTCHNGRLTAVHDGVQTNMLCERCGACWHPCAGRICRVDPAACPGCPMQTICTDDRRRYAVAESRPKTA